MKHGQVTVCFVKRRCRAGKLTVEDIELDGVTAESDDDASEEYVEFWFVPHECINALLQVFEKTTLLCVYQWVCRLIIADNIPC